MSADIPACSALIFDRTAARLCFASPSFAAVGARPAHLMATVLFEGLALTFAGGVLGIAASAVVLWLFNLVPIGDAARGYLGRPDLSIVTALVVCGFLAAAGCAAGYVPARRAARLNPVEALHEH